MTDREMNDLEGFFEPIEVPGHRLYSCLESASHVRVRVFSGHPDNCVSNGVLTFTPEEWASFRQNFTWSQDELHLKEVPE